MLEVLCPCPIRGENESIVHWENAIFCGRYFTKGRNIANTVIESELTCFPCLPEISNAWCWTV